MIILKTYSNIILKYITLSIYLLLFTFQKEIPLYNSKSTQIWWILRKRKFLIIKANKHLVKPTWQRDFNCIRNRIYYFIYDLFCQKEVKAEFFVVFFIIIFLSVSVNLMIVCSNNFPWNHLCSNNYIWPVFDLHNTP